MNIMLSASLYRNASKDVSDYFKGVKVKYQETISYIANTYLDSYIYTQWGTERTPTDASEPQTDCLTCCLLIILNLTRAPR